MVCLCQSPFNSLESPCRIYKLGYHLLPCALSDISDSKHLIRLLVNSKIFMSMITFFFFNLFI